MPRYIDPQPNQLKALLDLQDEAFVRAAYSTILKREADEHGLKHYLDQVRNGVDRSSIVRSLMSSEEARQHGLVDLRLRKSMLRERLRPRALLDRVFWSSASRRRILENQNYRVELECRELKSRVAELEFLVRETIRKSDLFCSHEGSSFPPDESVGARELLLVSPRVARTFADIKSAIALRNQ